MSSYVHSQRFGNELESVVYSFILGATARYSPKPPLCAMRSASRRFIHRTLSFGRIQNALSESGVRDSGGVGIFWSFQTEPERTSPPEIFDPDHGQLLLKSSFREQLNRKSLAASNSMMGKIRMLNTCRYRWKPIHNFHKAGVRSKSS